MRFSLSSSRACSFSVPVDSCSLILSSMRVHIFMHVNHTVSLSPTKIFGLKFIVFLGHHPNMTHPQSWNGFLDTKKET